MVPTGWIKAEETGHIGTCQEGMRATASECVKALVAVSSKAPGIVALVIRLNTKNL